MCTIAYVRYMRGIDSLHFDQTRQIILKILKPPKSELEAITRDFLNRSFLSREGDTYSFAHRSLGEFLYAQEIYDRIMRESSDIPDFNRIPAPSAGMVLELFGGINKFQEMLKTMKVNIVIPYKSKRDFNLIMFSLYSLANFISNLSNTERYYERIRKIDKEKYDDECLSFGDFTLSVLKVCYTERENILLQKTNIIRSFMKVWKLFMLTLSQYQELIQKLNLSN